MTDNESYNPWTVVNLVFNHLVEQGYHPVLGESGHPGEPAAQLLRALGVTPVGRGVPTNGWSSATARSSRTCSSRSSGPR